MASELEFNVQGTADCGQKWPVNFNAGITQLVSFDRSNDSGAIDGKTIGPILEKKIFIEILGLYFSSKLGRGSYIVYIA